jgi:eukaryotic-like serine/threonine-protein kinase
MSSEAAAVPAVSPASTSPVTSLGSATSPSPITLPAVATGRLTIQSDQYAVIFMSGRRLGMTPIVDLEVPTGTYTLRATARDSGVSKTIMVEVKAGESKGASFTFAE